MGKLTISMAMFNSLIQLSEGIVKRSIGKYNQSYLCHVYFITGTIFIGVQPSFTSFFAGFRSHPFRGCLLNGPGGAHGQLNWSLVAGRGHGHVTVMWVLVNDG